MPSADLYPKPVSSFYLFFFCLTDFLGVYICLCGNNVGIAVEINFLFLFCKYNDL